MAKGGNLQKILVVFIHKETDHNGDALLIFADAVNDQHGTVIFERGLNEFHRFIAIGQYRSQIRRFTEIQIERFEIAVSEIVFISVCRACTCVQGNGRYGSGNGRGRDGGRW